MFRVGIMSIDITIAQCIKMILYTKIQIMYNVHTLYLYILVNFLVNKIINQGLLVDTTSSLVVYKSVMKLVL